MMKRITLNRNGQEKPRDIEASDLMAGAVVLGTLVALVVGAMGVGTILLGLSILTGRALI